MEVLPIYALPFKTVFLIFIIFSFTGWISEVVYVGITSAHKFVNRGFLYGPLCPVYGFGGLAILTLPASLYSTWIELFFASMFLCTIVEYFVSWIMEKMFHTRWWDYSHFKIQLNGRICLLNSILFGLMGLGMIHFVYPFILNFLNSFSNFILKAVSDVIATALFVDLAFTVRKLVDFNTTMEKLHTFSESLRDHYGHEEWFRQDSFSEMLASVKEHAQIEKDRINQNVLEKIERVQNIRHKTIKNLLEKFPTMKSIRYKEEIAHIKLSLIKMEIKCEIKSKVEELKKINDNSKS